MSRLVRMTLAVMFVTAAGCAAASSIQSGKPAATSAVDADSIVAAPDRSDADRALDAGRKPAELLRFLDLRPGMRVADLMSGGGYTAELLARAVGRNGVVYSQNNRFVLERFAEKPWHARLSTPAMHNVVRVVRELDSPLPPEAGNLDLVLMVLFYHDTVWMGADRDAMNRAIFAALRPGGSYVIIDHSGRDASGTSEAQTLHRIEEKVVRDEVARAGFRFVREGDFLRNPLDKRDWNASPSAAGARRGTSDRFVLRLVKPAG